MRAHLAKMSLLFDEADTSGDGRLDLEESGGDLPALGDINGILRWAIGLANWLVTGDITIYILIIIQLLSS